jgi:4-amino-4-deoxy-L-arabinose transferase-like glycosyltransferase
VYEIALELFDRRAAILSAILLAFSPFDVQFAPTAFTDPLMVTLALASCLLALRGRHLPAGIAMGLAVMTKPTAVIFAPLAILFAALPLIKRGQARSLGRAALFLALGLGAVVLAVVAWDLVIRIGSVNFLSASAARYGGLRVAPVGKLLPRVRGWLQHLQYLTGSRVLNVTLIVGTVCLLAYGLWRRRERAGWIFEWVLAGFFLYFVAVHTVLTFSIWDRYMLGLASIAAILLSRVVLLPRDVLSRREGSDRAQVAYLVMLSVLLVAAIRHPTQVALRYGFPVGGDHGSFQGIDAVANYLKGNAPEGSVVFHKWLGWHYSCYLFDAPLDFYYYPSFEFVLKSSQQLPTNEKYVVFPSWTDPSGLSNFLEDNRWEMQQFYRTYRPNGTMSFTIYRIQPLGE